MSWQDAAACKGKPSEWFFPEVGTTADRARALCAACPVHDECRDYALTTGQQHGVWAGLSRTGLIRERTRRTIQCRECLKRFSVPSDVRPLPVFCSGVCRDEARRKSQVRSR